VTHAAILCMAVMLATRVARFFVVQHTKTGKNLPNDHKIYKMAIKYAPIYLKILRMSKNIPTAFIVRPSKIYPN
jgi:hypothetical protein